MKYPRRFPIHQQRDYSQDRGELAKHVLDDLVIEVSERQEIWVIGQVMQMCRPLRTRLTGKILQWVRLLIQPGPGNIGGLEASHD
jgi:hypothetical protein